MICGAFPVYSPVSRPSWNALSTNKASLVQCGLTLGESLDPLQLLDVRLVPQPIRLFAANQRVDIRDRHRDSLDVERLNLRGSIGIADAAGQRQNVDARIIAHDRERLDNDVRGIHLARNTPRQPLERLERAGSIVERR